MNGIELENVSRDRIVHDNVYSSSELRSETGEEGSPRPDMVQLPMGGGISEFHPN